MKNFNGCRNAAGATGTPCGDAEENLRMQMNNYQPRRYHHNWILQDTQRTRSRVLPHSRLWEETRTNQSVEWHKPTTYHNNWEIPPMIIRVDDRRVRW
jgi:hypothetical protein